MRVIGIGTDITECARVMQLVEAHGPERVFSPLEIRYCEGHRKAAERYAGRWAAKEAVLKALGTGWTKGISWLDLEITNLPSGQPTLALSGQARVFAEELGITHIHLSISHCATYAVAYALAVGDNA